MKKIASFFVANDDRKAGDRMVLPINGVEFPFRWCPPGTFTMGSPEDEANRDNDETQHQVTLSHGFWMLETPVTQKMWEKVTGSNPSRFNGAKFPVECVSWDDCQQFVEELNDLNVAPSGYRFSLPTEAQWEYACRAGTTTPFNFGSVLNGDKANCDGNFPYGTSAEGQYLEKTSEVGEYPANAWGLFDMHGNVWEWCSDWYGDYPSGSVTNPVGASEGLARVLRGGGWLRNARHCRSAYRNCNDPLYYRRRYYGVRLSLVRVDIIQNENHWDFGELLYTTGAMRISAADGFSGMGTKNFYETGFECLDHDQTQRISYSDVAAIWYVHRTLKQYEWPRELRIKSFDEREYLVAIEDHAEKPQNILALERVCDIIIRYIIQRMTREIDEKGETSWADGIFLTRSRLEQRLSDGTLHWYMPYSQVCSIKRDTRLNTVTITGHWATFTIMTFYNFLPALAILEAFCKRNGVDIEKSWLPPKSTASNENKPVRNFEVQPLDIELYEMQINLRQRCESQVSEQGDFVPIVETFTVHRNYQPELPADEIKLICRPFDNNEEDRQRVLEVAVTNISRTLEKFCVIAEGTKQEILQALDDISLFLDIKNDVLTICEELQRS